MLTKLLPASIQEEYFWDNFQLIGKPSRKGPEADLVMNFIRSSIPLPVNGEFSTIYIEPQLGNLRPDIVIVYWDPKITRSWPVARELLDLTDLKIIQMLSLLGPSAEDELKKFFPIRKLTSALERLFTANCAIYLENRWHLKELSSLFAIRRIIAVEAKISNINKAIEQAYANSWFSSESYILTTRKQPNSIIIERARQLGVGFWTYRKTGDIEQKLKAKEYLLPFSYGSWEFNEMVWRHFKGIINEYRL
jgi:hypothetical protein